MTKKFSFFASTFVLAVAAATSQAAQVTFTLDVSTPGAFSLFAEASQGDNFGMASYGALLTGNITALDHLSPNSAFALSSNGNGAAGFTLLRSADGSVGVAASQDTVVPTPNLIRGFGQTANSFASLGLTDATGAGEQLSWDAKLLLATGMYSGEIGFNETDAQTFSNVFTAATGVATQAADLVFVIDSGGGGGGDPLAVGTPASGSEISMQGAFDDGSGLLAQAIMVMNDNPDSDPALAIGDLVISNESVPGLYSAQINGDDPTKIDILMDVVLARQQPRGTLATADLVVETNGGNLSYTLTANVPEPSTVALASLALVGLAGFARRK